MNLKKNEKGKRERNKLVNLDVVIKRIRYLTEHLDDLLIKQIDPVKKAQFFGALFNKLPSYTDLKNGTPENDDFTGINSIFLLLKSRKELMVTSRRIELRLPG